MCRAIVLNPADNVATLLDTGRAGEPCTLQGEVSVRWSCCRTCPSATRSASPTPRKAPTSSNTVRASRRASQSLRVGEHTHIHNIESARGRGDLERR